MKKNSLLLGVCLAALGLAVAWSIHEQLYVKQEVAKTSEKQVEVSEATEAAAIREKLLLEALDSTNALATQASENVNALEREYWCMDSADNLPEDSHAWHLSVFTSDNWRNNKNEVQILSWLEHDEQLRKFRNQTMWHHYTPSREIYGKFKSVTYAGLPVIYLQNAKGEKVYCKSGKNVPTSARRLMYEIRAALRNCPNCTPNNPPNNKPNVVVNNTNYPVMPDTTDPEEEARRKREAERESRRKLDLAVKAEIARREKKTGKDKPKVSDSEEKNDAAWAIGAVAAVIAFLGVWVMMTKGKSSGYSMD